MVTNSVRCFAVAGGDNPSHDDATLCGWHHLPELIRSMPHLEIIVLMGGVAYSLLQRDRPLDIQHGIPLLVEDFVGTGSRVIMPVIHPAAGLHQPNEIARIRSDFKSLRDLYRDNKWNEVEDAVGRPSYWLWNHGDRGRSGKCMAIDTETDSGQPWCLTFSERYGEGFLIRAGNEVVLAAFRNRLNVHLGKGGKIFLHNAAFDRGVLRLMGVDIPWDCIIDTMQLAYHRCLPQGLKTLAYRLLGMDMRDYDDVVRPYAERKAFLYIESAVEALYLSDLWKTLVWLIAKDLIPPKTFKTVKTQAKHNAAWRETIAGYGLSPQAAAAQSVDLFALVISLPWHEKGSVSPWKRINRILVDRDKGKDIRPFRRWEKIDDDMKDHCLMLVGEMPSTGISEVPFELALEYACRDADATLRLGEKLLQIQHVEEP
jgi:hypothetical protein